MTKMKSRLKDVSARQGFTIIELLVAATITLVLVGLMLRVTTDTLGLFNSTSGKLTTKNQAKVILDYLARDFQGLIMKRDGGVWLAATIQPLQTGNGKGDSGMEDAQWDPPADVPGVFIKPKETLTSNGFEVGSLDLQVGTIASPIREGVRKLENYRFGQAGVWLRMITSIQDDNSGVAQLSAPAAVSYQIVRITPSDLSSGSADSNDRDSALAPRRRYQLYRSEVGPSNTFSAGYDLYSPGGYNTGVAFSGVPGNIRRPERKRLLANNVVDFGVRFWKRGGNGALTLLFPSGTAGSSPNLGFAATSATTSPTQPVGSAASVPPSTQMTYGFPDVADVFVRVLTDQGALLIENLEYGRIFPPNGISEADYAQYWWELAVQNSTVYTQRINLPVRP